MFKILRRLNKQEWMQVALAIILIFANVWLDLKVPEYMSKITELTVTEGSAMSDIWAEGIKMLICTVGSMILAVAVGFIAARIAASLSQRLRSEMFAKVDSFSMEEINKFSTSSLITRSTNDIIQIQMLVTMGLQAIIKAPITAVWALTKISGRGYEWTLATGIASGVLIITLAVLLILVIPKFKKMQSLTDDLNRVTREGLTGMRVIRAYNAEDYQQEKFEKVNKRLTDNQLYTTKGMAIMMPMMSSIMSGISLAIYWIGAYLIDGAGTDMAGMEERIMLFSDMVVFSSYGIQVIMSFMMLSMIFVLWPRASASAKRINEVFETELKIHSGKVKAGHADKKGLVEFNNVSFKYPDSSEYVLSDISFTAKKGETIAFIGSTGSGKTTLINLIPRFYDTSQGSITVDGVNVKDYDVDSLHNKIGYVPQKSVLFRGTISSNVAYGENGKGNASLEDIQKAVEIAQGKDFIESKTDKYNSEVAQGGTNYSGGQKQRLSIARAICRKPDIYIFDDSFSALDYKTDRVLRSALKKETADVTTFIVAQRIGTIMDADQIIVLDEGKMVGIGKHKDLLNNCEVYKEIALTQLSEEELSNV